MPTQVTNLSTVPVFLPPAYGGVIYPSFSRSLSDNLANVTAAFVAAYGSVPALVCLSALPDIPLGPGFGASISSSTPATLNGTATAGSSNQASAADHVHYVRVVGDGTAQSEYKDGAWVATVQYALHSTLTGLITHYIVEVTDTSAAVVYQAVAMGSTATKHAVIILKDRSYSGAYGTALTHSITFKPPSGKKLDNVTDGTLVILNGGGLISVEEDESGNWHRLGFTA